MASVHHGVLAAALGSTGGRREEGRGPRPRPSAVMTVESDVSDVGPARGQAVERIERAVCVVATMVAPDALLDSAAESAPLLVGGSRPWPRRPRIVVVCRAPGQASCEGHGRPAAERALEERRLVVVARVRCRSARIFRPWLRAVRQRLSKRRCARRWKRRSRLAACARGRLNTA